MHMADALLSPAVGGAMIAVSACAIGYSIKKIESTDIGDKKLPLMAVSGAFVFAAQMINFTIPATGSSGHIGGGMLLAGMLGGFPALLTIAAVLIIQCLFFADGGLLALGANIFNMGVIPCLIIYPLIFKPILKAKINAKRLTVASIVSSIVALQLGAFGVVLETLLSGITELPFSTFVTLMQPIHLAIGAVEGVITAAVLAFVYNTRPEILESSLGKASIPEKINIKKTIIILAVVAALVAGGLSLFASSYPDGLEWSMEKVAGTTELEREDSVHIGAAEIQDSVAIMPDYDFKDATEGGAGTTVAGLVGALITCILAGVVGFIISASKKKLKRI
ncbi:MAG: energy-coupling factor ABC transporter permease [Lachnospiraceae bacterium]|nr:energy-coupling factor ABC transporter permease [Lachnospiraceae bacterium]